MRWWFVAVNVYETARVNWRIRKEERSDTRELEGENLVAEIARRWR